MRIEKFQYIRELHQFEGKEVTLKGWVSNKRESKGLVFIILRDGSGFSQCVVDANKVNAEVFEDAKKLTMESSVTLVGSVVKDERQLGGYELQVTGLEIIQIADEYPIAKKEHGIEFLFFKSNLRRTFCYGFIK